MARLVIDTDTASDDAVALVMALRHPDTVVEAITVGAGNVPLEQAVQNALYTVELCGADVPVHAGIAAPLLLPLQTAQHVHGRDGMGDLGLPLHGREPAEGHAVDVLVETIRAHAGEITLVCLGPLMNVATALLRDPGLAACVERCVVMGGVSDGRGNITPLGEYNFWADPHAAQIVMRSGMPVELVGWDISRKYGLLDDAELAAVRATGELGRFAIDVNRTVATFSRESSGLDGTDFPDPIAMAIALDPTVATDVRRLRVDVDTSPGVGRGQTVVDHAGLTGEPPNVDVTFAASHEQFVASLMAAVQGDAAPVRSKEESTA
ncbi:MAG TPA: nucleoside hydrolase [Conexibacter sp.]|nr:nucleoside hydrolase [Conexibacter sp.]